VPRFGCRWSGQAAGRASGARPRLRPRADCPPRGTAMRLTEMMPYRWYVTGIPVLGAPDNNQVRDAAASARAEHAWSGHAERDHHSAPPAADSAWAAREFNRGIPGSPTGLGCWPAGGHPSWRTGPVCLLPGGARLVGARFVGPDRRPASGFADPRLPPGVPVCPDSLVVQLRNSRQSTGQPAYNAAQGLQSPGCTRARACTPTPQTGQLRDGFTSGLAFRDVTDLVVACSSCG
jgi:hypothetical protein